MRSSLTAMNFIVLGDRHTGTGRLAAGICRAAPQAERPLGVVCQPERVEAGPLGPARARAPVNQLPFKKRKSLSGGPLYFHTRRSVPCF